MSATTSCALPPCHVRILSGLALYSAVRAAQEASSAEAQRGFVRAGHGCGRL